MSGTKPPQGGGELSGLLRHAEALQRDLEKALVDLRSEVVEGQDATRMVTVRFTGDGGVKEVRVSLPSLSEPQRKAIEDALAVALKIALERLFELRKTRASTVTKSLSLPGLFL